MEVYINRGAAGKESKAFVGRMSDEKALDMAAKVVSEGFVFGVRNAFSATAEPQQRSNGIGRIWIDDLGVSPQSQSRSAKEARRRRTCASVATTGLRGKTGYEENTIRISTSLHRVMVCSFC